MLLVSIKTNDDILNLKYKIFLTSQIHEDGIKLLKREVKVVFPQKPLNLLTSEDIIKVGKDSDGIIVVTNVEQITREVIWSLPKIKIIARHGVGYENVDVDAARAKGIVVTISPVLEQTIADHAFALLLSLARNLCKAHQYVVSKRWTTRDPYKYMGTDVHEKNAGIIGMGRIGTQISKRAKGFNMKVLYYDPIRKPQYEKTLGIEYRSLNDLLKKSDAIFVSAPLTKETRGMINKDKFKLMKHSAFLINVARGPIINHKDLFEVLTKKRIAGAGLDVFDEEPIPLNSPLFKFDNVLLTPHLAPNTIECRKRMAVTVAEEVLRVLHGEKPRYDI